MDIPLDSRIDLTRWTVTSSLCGLSEGHHQLKSGGRFPALVKDARVVDFIVDTTPPTIGQIRPRSGSATRESVTNIVGETEPLARVSVEDASGKALDLVQADADGAFTARVQLADGANKLTSGAKDRAGNSFRTGPWSIFVDRSSHRRSGLAIRLTRPSSRRKPSLALRAQGEQRRLSLAHSRASP